MPDGGLTKHSRDVSAAIKIVSKHVGEHRIVDELMILVGVWEAEFRGQSLTVSDVARLRDMLSSTASNIVARLGDFAADGTSNPTRN